MGCLAMEVLAMSAGTSASVVVLAMLSKGSLPDSARHSSAYVRVRARGGAAGTARSRSWRIHVEVQRAWEYRDEVETRDLDGAQVEYYPRCATIGAQTRISVPVLGRRAFDIALRQVWLLRAGCES
jgi:hypothetical protein